MGKKDNQDTRSSGEDMTQRQRELLQRMEENIRIHKKDDDALSNEDNREKNNE